VAYHSIVDAMSNKEGS